MTSLVDLKTRVWASAVSTSRSVKLKTLPAVRYWDGLTLEELGFLGFSIQPQWLEWELLPYSWHNLDRELSIYHSSGPLGPELVIDPTSRSLRCRPGTKVARSLLACSLSTCKCDTK